MEKDSRPNILFIMTDQQHAGMMSCTGNTRLKTPAMDSLARAGMRFERAYCTNPVCVPSRTSMATGMMPGRIGASDNRPGMKIDTLPSEVDNHSMGKMMKRAGYDTFYGGKVHMCNLLNPTQAGYDAYDKDEREGLPAACLKFINQERDKPFFAVASFINPHDICFAHAAHQGKDVHNVLSLYEEASALPLDQLPPLPENYEIPEGEPAAIEAHLDPNAVTPAITMRQEYDERQWRIYRWIYCRLTEQVDRHIGIILDGLKARGLEDNTLIMFVSDHGNMDASHKLSSKGLLYEESVGVPFVMKYKGVIPSGKTDASHLVSTGLDILPTLCDYAEIEAPAHLLGKSVRPLVEDKSVDTWRSYIVAENHWSRMIQSQTFKYCVYAPSDHQASLVDTVNDPGEMQNLIHDPKFEDVLVEHRKFLAEWIHLSKDEDGMQYI
ncbi:MAG: sulfatase-like hydrolase/transferase [Candidatus Latescibacteria bacterium]|nr:sulfatase-like hydrolase/transferase [Candidatus Latescibacterota bacterium]